MSHYSVSSIELTSSLSENFAADIEASSVLDAKVLTLMILNHIVLCK